MDENVRWTLTVSRETDQGLRSLLSREQRRRRGALSRFVEQAVRKEIFLRTLARTRSRNARISARTIDAEIAEAVSHVRAAGGKRAQGARR